MNTSLVRAGIWFLAFLLYDIAEKYIYAILALYLLYLSFNKNMTKIWIAFIGWLFSDFIVGLLFSVIGMRTIFVVGKIFVILWLLTDTNNIDRLSDMFTNIYKKNNTHIDDKVKQAEVYIFREQIWLSNKVITGRANIVELLTKYTGIQFTNKIESDLSDFASKNGYSLRAVDINTIIDMANGPSNNTEKWKNIVEYVDKKTFSTVEGNNKLRVMLGL